jgi:hypothetical protein
VRHQGDQNVAVILTRNPIDAFGDQVVTLRPKPDRRRTPRRAVLPPSAPGAHDAGTGESGPAARARLHGASVRPPERI